MVRQAHHPEPVEGQNTNNKQIPMTEIQKSKLSVSLESISEPFSSLNIGNCDLPFDLAQGGEPVEPFVIWCLLFGIYPTNLIFKICDTMG